MRRSTESQLVGLVSLGDGSTLTLDFTTGQLDPRLTFSRASNATVINSSGLVQTVNADLPRFDHDPTTLAPRGLLIEGAATNLVTYSVCSTTGWTGLNATGTNNNATAPDNNTAATLWTGGSGGTNRAYSSTFSITNGTSYTLSVYVKKPSTNAARYAKIDMRSSIEGDVGWPANGVLDLDTGIASGTGFTATAMPNGWYRIVSTGTVNTTTNARAFLRITDATGSIAITSTNALLWWGAQLEAGSGSSSYIPTGASQVTRNADICYMASADHPWFQSKNNCVLFMQCEIPRTSNFGNLMYLGQWSGGEYSYGHQVYSFAGSAVSSNTKINAATSTDQVLFGNQPVPIGLKIAMCPNSDAARLARAWNGTALETTGLTPTASRFPAWTQQARFGIGTNAISLGSSTACNIYVRTVKFFPFAMSNAQLQALTT